MKTTVSLPDDLFELAEIAAKRMHLSRSKLYARAITEFLNRESAEITRRLDRIYGTTPAGVDPVLLQAQWLSLDKEE